MSYIERSSLNATLDKHHGFKHNISDHPLLKFNELKKLALRSPKIRYHSANLARSQRFDTARDEHQTGLSIEETLDNIEVSGSFVYLMEVEKDPLYGPMVKDFFKEIEKEVLKRHSKICEPAAWIFITSPGGVTPYHRDFNANYLFQIQGQKKLWVWDHNDKEVVGQLENEVFHGVHSLANTLYTEEKFKKAHQYELTSSQGVYFAYTDPHMLENGTEEVSITLSLTYLTPEDYQVRRIYKINQLLRKLGFFPKDLDVSPIYNQIKLGLHWLLRNIIYRSSKDWKAA